MPEYVYARHDFLPENSDEISFHAGEAIEVIEKDDIYSDGWWQGKNKAGDIGLFPESYTTNIPPVPVPAALPPPVNTVSQDLIPPTEVHTPTTLHSLREEPENISAHGSPNPEAPTNGFVPPQNDEVMKATMTDVQKAIEQLGKNDADGARSFSFASSREGDWTDREADSDRDTEDTDGEGGETWHTNARQKLAEKARRANLKAAGEENHPPTRNSVPPIEVEMSDESEGEEDQHLRPQSDASFLRNHPHIPEEDEEEEHKLYQSQPQYSSSPISMPEVPEVTPPSPIEDDLPTATANHQFPRDRSQSPVSDYRSNGISLPTPISPNTFDSELPRAITKDDDRPSPPPAAKSIEARNSLTPIRHTNGLPSPTASSFASVGIQQSLTPAGSGSPLKSSANLRRESSSSQLPKSRSTTPPAEWSVEEVSDWLKSKGFDQATCDKFIEQEITGDVLLELNVDLLKTEIGIIAFGKRKRIANCIEELRKPPSIIESSQTTNSESLFSHSRTMSSAQQSFFYSPPTMESQTAIPSIMSHESPPLTSELPETPNQDVSRRRSRRGSDPGSINGGLIDMLRGNSRNSRNSIIGLGINYSGKYEKNRPPDLSFTAVESSFDPKALSTDNIITLQDDDQAPLSDNDAGNSPNSPNAKSKRRRVFGRSVESNTKEGKDTSNRNSKEVSTPISSSSKRESLEDAVPAVRHRPKRSMDGTKASERLSLFGNTFSGTLGKSRKPPPRYSSSIGSDHEKEKSSPGGTLSRLYHIGDRKASSQRPGTGDATLKAKEKEAKASKDRGSKDSKEPKDVQDVKKDQDLRDTKKDRDSKDVKKDGKKDRDSKDQPALLRKRTSSGGDRVSVAQVAGISGLKEGLSVLDQIGTPDYNGWLHKKGDSYNAWKYRYLVLRGPHLYWMRSNSKTETKIKGYVNVAGYKVVPDENIRPGSYGFKMIHDNDKIHYFSSEAQLVVREWMKALMKSTIDRDYTKPVMSSVNIPTIPLTVAQAMNPPPRPPSPTSRAATQKASRPANPNQLSSRDAQILLMGIVPNADNRENGTDRSRIESFFADDIVPSPLEPVTPTSPKARAPPRPSREMRRGTSTSSVDFSAPVDDSLIEWANSHLAPALKINDVTGSICGGLTLLRLAESIRGKPSSPPVLDSAFPLGPNDDKLDGLFRLFDFLLDNDVRIGSVSINDVRQGKRDKIVQLLRALKAWEDKRRQIAMSVANGATTPFMTGVGMPWMGA